MDTVISTQTALLTEVQEQSAKFGDDVKYLVSTVVKFGLAEKYKKFEKIFLMLWTFTK